jgi:hypothetical protein
MSRFGARLLYPATLSFQIQLGLAIPAPHDSSNILYRTARELEVIRELTACLSIAGEYFANVDGAGLLLVAAELSGFGGATSETETNNAVRKPPVTLPEAPSTVQGATRANALDLRDAPELVARSLIERWLPAFWRNERDPFELIVPPR